MDLDNKLAPISVPTQISELPQPPPPALASSTEDPKEWEQKSGQILTAIRCFVDGLRSAPDLKVKAHLSPAINGLGEIKGGKEVGNNGVSLVMHLTSLGVMQQVQNLQQQGEQSPIQPDPQLSRPMPETEISLGALLHNRYEDDERKIILHEVIFPLLRHLEQCYEILDNLPQSQISQSTIESPSKPQSQPKTRRNRRKSEVPPPLGMLSLNDYTNVACLLEFAVSASLVPCLEYPKIYLPPLTCPPTNNRNIPINTMQLHKINSRSTAMAQKRIQNLPKSLAGRISKMALTWGTICVAENHDSLSEKLLTLISEHCAEDSRNRHQIYHTYNIFQAYNEMTTLATAIGRLLLLDRFRPMLLQRHLSDVYLALLISERLRWYLSRLEKQGSCEIVELLEVETMTEKRNSQQLQSLHQALMSSPLTFSSSLISAAASPSVSAAKFIDCLEAAFAYRNLLGGGAAMLVADGSHPVIPRWLRLRLGQSLTKLAQEDLQSLVEVFVAYACGPGGGNDSDTNMTKDDVMTGAAARLARALCAEPMGAPNSSCSKRIASSFQDQLFTQFVKFLVEEGEGYIVRLKANRDNDWARSRLSMAMHLTLWATIAQLPIENIHSFFITKLVSGIIPLDKADLCNPRTFTSMQSIAAISAWLFTIPSSLDPLAEKKVLSLLLGSLPSNKGTIIGQTLLLAAPFPGAKKETPNSTLIVEINEDGSDEKVFAKLAEVTLAQTIHIVVVSLGDSESSSGQDKFAPIALELLKAVSAGAIDKEGNCFGTSHSYADYERSLCQGKVNRRNSDAANDIDLPSMIEGVENRAKCLVGAIASLSECTDKSTDIAERSNSSVHLLSSSLFRLVLLLHYSTYADPSDDDCNEHKKMLSQVNLELDELMRSNGDELRIVATVLLASLCENCPPSLLMGSAQGNNGVLEMLGLIITSAAVCFEEEQTQDTIRDSEELFSTTSIVLSLLIALLELGSQKRSNVDESFFQSILPSLRVLSSGVKANGSLVLANKAMIVPELAEMASHAMALIVARGEIVNIDDVQTSPVDMKKSRMGAIFEILSQAECDLQSSQPPLRAKGVVSLRHIARSLVDGESGNENSDLNRLHLSSYEAGRTAVITEISESTADPTNVFSAQEEIARISRSLARICLDALADPESYVYLASIQTLVIISDMCPSDIMPLMGQVIAKGGVVIDVATAESDEASVELLLSPEQRIKAIEALIFMIRRRGEGIFIYGPTLLNNMLFGSSSGQRHTSKRIKEKDSPEIIQSETHSYFMGDKHGECNDTDIDEKKIRLNTGGPVFLMEEIDVLRAGAISVVCELVSVLDPTTVALYCHILVGLATDILELELSRPVRRVAACLARELYACTMREIMSHGGGSRECSSTMAVAMVNSNEEKMYNRLSRCSSSVDLTEKNRLVDPATQARSAEAIEIRLELQAMGALEAAAVIAHNLEQELNDPRVQAVRRAMYNPVE